MQDYNIDGPDRETAGWRSRKCFRGSVHIIAKVFHAKNSNMDLMADRQLIVLVTNTVTLTVLLCCLHGVSVAQTSSMEATERLVEQHVRAGEPVSLDKQESKEIGASFLKQLLESYRPPVDKPSRGIHIENAGISGPLNLERMTIPYLLVLENCTFKDDLDFTGSSFQKGLSLSKSKFLGRAIFFQISVEGELRVNRGEFKQETNFDNIKVSGTVQLYQSKFDGPFTLANSDMDKLECAQEDQDYGRAEFRSSADFYSISVKGDASFTHTLFAGPVDFASIDIGKNFELTKAQFTDASQDIRFFSMKVGGNAFFNQTEFQGGFNMSRAEVGKTLEFNQTQARNTGKHKSLLGMKVDTAVFDRAIISPPYTFEDLDYRLFNTGSAAPETSLALINGSAFSPSSYLRLESYYRSRGMEQAANDVYFAMRSRESSVSGWAKYLSNGFLLITVGYGKWPWLALVWSLVFIGIGCGFFKKENMELREKKDDANYAGKYNRLWYSIALFLPIVELEDTKVWKPKPQARQARTYMRVHVILGYLLIPIGLAAWTGLIK